MFCAKDSLYIDKEAMKLLDDMFHVSLEMCAYKVTRKFIFTTSLSIPMVIGK